MAAMLQTVALITSSAQSHILLVLVLKAMGKPQDLHYSASAYDINVM